MRSATISGFDNKYTLFEDGVVISRVRTKSGKALKPYTDVAGYKHVILQVNNIEKTVKIHRLLAIYFIPNPLNLPDVNHIDGNPLNNALSNLEWCTTSHNIRHAVKMGRIKTKTLHQKDKNGVLVNTFNSLTEAKEAGFQKGNISKCCHGKREMAHGFVWSYA